MTQRLRLAVAFYYDAQGIVDDYFLHLLDALRPFSARIVLVSNGKLDAKSVKAASAYVDELIVRENVGYDVGAYREALQRVGIENLDKYDEVIFFNHTFYGPLFPLSELFDEMDGRPCDFWGISAHKELRPNPIDFSAKLPFHLNSHFIVVRRPMHQSEAFRQYWEGMRAIDSYNDSIIHHETRFTEFFRSLGYVCSVYVDPDLYQSPYPVLMEVDKTIERRSPILKRRLFFHDPIFMDAEAVDVSRALRLIDQTSHYDMALVWKSIGRNAPPRILNTNAALMSVLPDIRLRTTKRSKTIRVAVFAHIFYVDMVPEILAFAKSIPAPFDLIVTTDTREKEEQIGKMLADTDGFGIWKIIVCRSNHGRDTAALLIECREYVLERHYDLICRIHSKKSPQDGAKGDMFKRHMFENLLNSRGYVGNIIEMFAADNTLGIVFPPLIHIGYPTMGHSWFGNRGKVEELAKKLKLNVVLDDNTPVAPNGGMFWFRPEALSKLFQHKWKQSDFATQSYADGGLSHAIERLFAYVALDAGYCFRHVSTSAQAEQNYVRLEYKLMTVLSKLPLAPMRRQIELLGLQTQPSALGVAGSFELFVRAVGRSLAFRFPRVFRITYPIYRLGGAGLKHLARWR